jgi:hypothetical protein
MIRDMWSKGIVHREGSHWIHMMDERCFMWARDCGSGLSS